MRIYIGMQKSNQSYRITMAQISPHSAKRPLGAGGKLSTCVSEEELVELRYNEEDELRYQSTNNLKR